MLVAMYGLCQPYSTGTCQLANGMEPGMQSIRQVLLWNMAESHPNFNDR